MWNYGKFAGQRFQESHHLFHFLFVERAADLAFAHDRYGLIECFGGTVMEVGVGEFYIAQWCDPEDIPV